MSIDWDESLATGNSVIDNQHREIFKRFDGMLDACKQRKGKEEVTKVLLFLSDYVQSHFAMEEKLQKDHHYPLYPAHKAQHEGFIKELQYLESQFRDGGATLSLVIQTNQTLVNWLINHINETDRALAVYLQSAE